MPIPSLHEHEELAAWLRLVLTPGLGRGLARRLLATLGPPVQVLAAGRDAISQALARDPSADGTLLPPDVDDGRAQAAPGRSPAGLAAALLSPQRDRDALIERTLRWAEAPDHHLLPLGHPLYPARLLEAADPPLVLHVRGDATCLSRPSLAIVGARQATQGGRDHARDFAHALGRAGLVVVSGLARGIDAAAHEGALETPSGTIAVVGTGADQCYPAGHRALDARIALHGAVVSEFPPGTAPRPHHFPQRNRIIAAMTLGTLVVEAAPASGSLVTARLALDAGREVMAIPGSIHAPMARGCHRLIREGAALIEEPDDVLRALGLPVAEPPAPAPRRRPTGARTVSRRPARPGDRHPDAPSSPLPLETPPVATGTQATFDLASESPADGLDATGRAVLDALGFDPQPPDLLALRCGLDPGTLGATVVMLELDGLVERLPDGRLARRASLAPRRNAPL